MTKKKEAKKAAPKVTLSKEAILEDAISQAKDDIVCVEMENAELKKELKEAKADLEPYAKENRTLCAHRNSLARDVQDLKVERDALAARVLELEPGTKFNKFELVKRTDTLEAKFELPPEEKLVWVDLTATISKRDGRIAALEAFLREGLRTATWNSTLAAELLK